MFFPPLHSVLRPLLLLLIFFSSFTQMATVNSGEQFRHGTAQFHRVELVGGQQQQQQGIMMGERGGGGGGQLGSAMGQSHHHSHAHHHQRLNRCYSCMSPLYEQLFKGGDLGSFFYEPRNFTAQCEDPMDTRGIGLVPCRGICLSLAQEFIIMGRKTGKRLWMRGCAHSLSRHGYQNRTIAYFAEFDLCREVHASDLFRLSDHSTEDHYFGTGNGAAAGGPMDGHKILVCSCLGDRCNVQTNGVSSNIHVIPSSSLSILLLLLLLLSAPSIFLNSPLLFNPL